MHHQYMPFAGSSKACSLCGEEKPLDAFYRQKGGWGGRRAACVVCTKAQNAARYEVNRAAVLTKQRHRRAAPSESRREADRLWRLANPDKVKAILVRYRRSERGRIKNRLQRHLRRAGRGTHFRPEDVVARLRRQRSRCYWCGTSIADAYQIDHVVPVSRGGTNEPSNIVLACIHCNSAKRARLPHEWPQGGRLL